MQVLQDKDFDLLAPAAHRQWQGLDWALAGASFEDIMDRVPELLCKAGGSANIRLFAFRQKAFSLSLIYQSAQDPFLQDLARHTGAIFDGNEIPLQENSLLWRILEARHVHAVAKNELPDIMLEMTGSPFLRSMAMWMNRFGHGRQLLLVPLAAGPHTFGLITLSQGPEASEEQLNGLKRFSLMISAALSKASR